MTQHERNVEVSLRLISFQILAFTVIFIVFTLSGK